jgi:molybdopterin-guanine dinucleotide biosynthesis protein A
MSIERAEITGLIVARERRGRFGGVDKGLENYLGMPLALHAMLRLAPQVGELMVNANANLAAYESMGVAVWPDASQDYAGTLAGWLTGLERCATPYMVAVPCDVPAFPLDLVERLAGGLAGANAQIAMAVARDAAATRLQPAFCLMNSALLESLAQFLHAGRTEITGWTGRHRCVEVVFDDAPAFVEASTISTRSGGNG